MAHGRNGKQRSLQQLCLAQRPDHRIGQRCVPGQARQGRQNLRRHSTGPFGAMHRCDVYFPRARASGSSRRESAMHGVADPWRDFVLRSTFA
jgi:hypothetical protein